MAFVDPIGIQSILCILIAIDSLIPVLIPPLSIASQFFTCSVKCFSTSGYDLVSAAASYSNHYDNHSQSDDQA